MAGGSLLALLDDIATILDDVAVMTKVAAKKTAGVVGDDLALNANQVTGINADRELPVVWAVAKGSMLNKVILIPIALIVSAFAPYLIMPALMIGGLYLCYEGGEKIIEKLFHKKVSKNIEEEAKDILNSEKERILHPEDERKIEKEKIKGAIKTDFVLSAEILVISLGAAATATLMSQAIVLSIIGVVMTIGVYGLVAGIVKADDFGLWLINKKDSPYYNKFGVGIVNFMPIFMKVLAFIGTVAMFAVGGSILAHGIPFVANFAHGLNTIMSTLLDIGVGLLAGALSVGVMELKEKVIHLFSSKNKQIK